jgi:hypothetical protein
MQEQGSVVVQFDQDVLAAPLEFADRRSGQPPRQHRWKRTAQILPAQFGDDDVPAGHLERQTAAHGFDFGKFGHAAIFLPHA